MVAVAVEEVRLWCLAGVVVLMLVYGLERNDGLWCFWCFVRVWCLAEVVVCGGV